LKRDVSSKEEDWRWGNIHVNHYVSMPWSMTPLRHLFEREVPTPGNDYTINFSKYEYNHLGEGLSTFKGSHCANYKQVI
jgi:hypothetical protein